MNTKIRPIQIILFLFVLVFGSCSEQESITKRTLVRIDFEKDILDDIKVTKIIPLETTENSIVEYVSRISLVGDRIFILDNRIRRTLFLFDSDGQFIKHIASGKGPGEILNAIDYHMDAKLEEVTLLDPFQKKLLKYDFDLNHVASEAYETSENYLPIIKWFKQHGRDEWITLSQHPAVPDQPAFTYSVLSNDLSQIVTEFLPQRHADLANVKLSSTISRENYDPVYCRPFDQSLYHIKNNKMVPSYQLDFGPYSISDQDIAKGLPHLSQLYREGKIANIQGDLIHNRHYLAASIAFNKKIEYFIYSKKENKVGCSINSKILPRGFLKGMVDEHTFVMVATAFHFKEYLKTNPLKLNVPEGISEADNYIIVQFTMN